MCHICSVLPSAVLAIIKWRHHWQRTETDLSQSLWKMHLSRVWPWVRKASLCSVISTTFSFSQWKDSKGRTTLTRPTSKLPSIQPSCFPRFIFYVLSFDFDFFPIKVQILFHFLYVNKRHTSMNGLMSRWLHVLLNSLDSPGLTLNEMICGGPFSQLITHNATDWATRGLKHSGVNHTPSMNAWTYTLVSRFCCNPV